MGVGILNPVKKSGFTGFLLLDIKNKNTTSIMVLVGERVATEDLLKPYDILVL